MYVRVEEFIDVLEEAMKKNVEFVLPLHGTSMEPFFHTNDQAVLVAPKNIKKRDVVFYRRDNGQYVFHRILKIKNDKYYITGDNQTDLEEVRKDQVIAKMNGFFIHGKYCKASNSRYCFKTWIWSNLFLRKCYWHLFCPGRYRNKEKRK